MPVFSNIFSMPNWRTLNDAGVIDSASVSPKASHRPNRPILYLVLCGIFLIVAIVCATAIMVFQFRDRALANSEREMQNKALLLAQQVDHEFEELELVEESIIERIDSAMYASSQGLRQSILSEGTHHIFQDKIAGLAHVAAIRLFDAQGQLINSSKSWPIPFVNIADRDYFKMLKSASQTKPFLSQPVQDSSSGAWSVEFARNMASSDGEFLGIVSGEIKLEQFSKFFGTLALGDYNSVALFRNDGLLLVRYPHIQSAIGSVYSVGADALGDRQSGTTRLFGRMDNKDRLLVARRLQHFPLYVTVSSDMETILSDWRQQTTFLISVAALSGLAIGLIFWLIVRKLLQGHKWSKQRLTLEKLRLNSAINNMTQGLLLFDSSERIVVCNQRYIDIYGLSADVVKPGCTIRELITHRKASGSFSDDVDQYIGALRTKLFQGIAFTQTIETTDGRSIQIVNQPLTLGGWVATHEDITGKVQSENEKNKQQLQLDSALNNISQGLIMFDSSAQIVVCNKRYVEMNGLSPDVVKPGCTLLELLRHRIATHVAFTDEPEQYMQDLLATIRKGKIESKIRVLEDGRIFSVVNHPMPDGGWVATNEDITERRRSEQLIEHMAFHDSLTGLPNRKLFRENLEEALKRLTCGEQLAILYLDLDNFKSVNDTLGHLVGDELLKAVAERIRNCTGNIDTLARLGGDEFAILQADAGLSDLAHFATRINEALKAPYFLNGHQLIVEASIGISIAPGDGVDPEQLLKNADMSMYEAKKHGRGSFHFFESGLDARVKARTDLESDLRNAITRGEFELYYQPLVNLRDNTIAGCEALLRWHHPERGMISPAEFIPVAEESGLIIQIGEWVLKTACAEAMTWPNDIRVAVNVSPVQFKNQALVLTVIGALATSGLSARRLEVEITESVLMRDDVAALVKLSQLQELGVRIAMDDFGTGYSSLSYLQRIPFDKIKIDRSFITNVVEDHCSRAIVQAVINIAQSRNIGTVAEGVETEQQSGLLRSLGCTQMQGFLFSRPRPAAELKGLFWSNCTKAVRTA